MLAADKLQLQSQLRQQAVSLKEKELNLHHSNLTTVGTQAAVLAGLDITMLIEFTPRLVADEALGVYYARFLQFIYYIMITAAFCANLRVVAQTTVLSVLGAGLALRGPDGSMMIATDVLYQERRTVFVTFACGLALTCSSVFCAVWLMLHWEAALACQAVVAVASYQIYANYRRINRLLDFDENDTVDFRDIMEGPGNIQLFAKQMGRRFMSSSSPSAANGVVHHKKSSSRKNAAAAEDSSSHTSDDDYDYDHDRYGGAKVKSRSRKQPTLQTV
jgi:hypothetical protein